MSESLNEMNAGDTLEVLLPGQNKKIKGIVSKIKYGASKGSAVIKFLFNVKDFGEFAVAVWQSNSEYEKGKKICPSLN